MKILSTAALFLFALGSMAQDLNTDIFLIDLAEKQDSLIFSNVRNISNNLGYDSQPCFQSDQLLLYASNRGGQTDIAQYSLRFEKQFWLHESEGSSQYSPQAIPGSPHLMSIHLQPDGYQRLYQHHLTSGEVSLVHPDLRVAYFAMYDKQLLLASVLGITDLELVWANLQTGRVDTLLTRSGRSIHRIPDGKMSYTAVNEQGSWDVFQFDPETRESYFITQLPVGVQDHIWLDDVRILIGSGSKLYLYDPFIEQNWMEVADLSGQGLKNISRMAISPDGKSLAVVAEPAVND